MPGLHMLFPAELVVLLLFLQPLLHRCSFCCVLPTEELTARSYGANLRAVCLLFLQLTHCSGFQRPALYNTETLFHGH